MKHPNREPVDDSGHGLDAGQQNTSRTRTSLPLVTRQPFTPRADRSGTVPMGSITTTEVCNLTCVMCHFNGPNAVKKGKTLPPALVEKTVDQLSPGQEIWFAATGEFFMDPNALDHLRAASRRGLKPCVLSHGQLFTPQLLDEVLEAGVRLIRMSADSTDPEQFRRIRRGGELQRILDACQYLRERKVQYPDLRVEINCTLFKNTFPKQQEMVDFWRGKVDQVNFNAEYYDTWRYRNLFFDPTERNDCKVQLYVLPSGRIAPCCAMMVHAHDHDVSWLPHVAEVSLDEAYRRLSDLYEDPTSPLGKLCQTCDWWIMWTPPVDGTTPYARSVSLDDPRPPEAEPPSLWSRAVARVVGR